MCGVSSYYYSFFVFVFVSSASKYPFPKIRLVSFPIRFAAGNNSHTRSYTAHGCVAKDGSNPKITWGKDPKHFTWMAGD